MAFAFACRRCLGRVPSTAPVCRYNGTTGELFNLIRTGSKMPPVSSIDRALSVWMDDHKQQPVVVVETIHGDSVLLVNAQCGDSSACVLGSGVI